MGDVGDFFANAYGGVDYFHSLVLLSIIQEQQRSIMSLKKTDKECRNADFNMCWQCGYNFNMDNLPDSDDAEFICPSCKAVMTADDLYHNESDYVWVL